MENDTAVDTYPAGPVAASTGSMVSRLSATGGDLVGEMYYYPDMQGLNTALRLIDVEHMTQNIGKKPASYACYAMHHVSQNNQREWGWVTDRLENFLQRGWKGNASKIYPCRIGSGAVEIDYHTPITPMEIEISQGFQKASDQALKYLEQKEKQMPDNTQSDYGSTRISSVSSNTRHIDTGSPSEFERKQAQAESETRLIARMVAADAASKLMIEGLSSAIGKSSNKEFADWFEQTMNTEHGRSFVQLAFGWGSMFAPSSAPEFIHNMGEAMRINGGAKLGGSLVNMLIDSFKKLPPEIQAEFSPKMLSEGTVGSHVNEFMKNVERETVSVNGKK